MEVRHDPVCRLALGGRPGLRQRGVGGHACKLAGAHRRQDLESETTAAVELVGPSEHDRDDRGSGSKREIGDPETQRSGRPRGRRRCPSPGRGTGPRRPRGLARRRQVRVDGGTTATRPDRDHAPDAAEHPAPPARPEHRPAVAEEDQPWLDREVVGDDEWIDPGSMGQSCRDPAPGRRPVGVPGQELRAENLGPEAEDTSAEPADRVRATGGRAARRRPLAGR